MSECGCVVGGCGCGAGKGMQVERGMAVEKKQGIHNITLLLLLLQYFWMSSLHRLWLIRVGLSSRRRRIYITTHHMLLLPLGESLSLLKEKE